MTVKEAKIAQAQPYRSRSVRGLESYFEQVAVNYAAVANPFEYYKWFIDELAGLPDVDFAPLSLAMNNPSTASRRIILRHDIDADPIAGLRAARYLARHGLAGSFYLLHTALYYGEFVDGLFLRQAVLSEWIEEFIVAGGELGLHNDALGAFLNHGVDGGSAVRTELQWMREQGANVQGTVAHNSAPSHGAENYEIFKGHVLWDREVRAPDGRQLALGTLDPVELGLGYEGTWGVPHAEVDVVAAEAFTRRKVTDVRDEAWMREYLVENPICRWAVDGQFWLIGRDKWVAAGCIDDEPFFEFDADGRRVIEMIGALPGGVRAVIVVHPEYVRL